MGQMNEEQMTEALGVPLEKKMKYKVRISIEYIVEGEYDIDAAYEAKRQLEHDMQIHSDIIHLFHFEPIKLEE